MLQTSIPQVIRIAAGTIVLIALVNILANYGSKVFSAKGSELFVKNMRDRLSTIRQADLILVVKNGKIIEQGVHEEFAKNKYKKSD